MSKLNKEQFLKTLPPEIERVKMTKQLAKELAWIVYQNTRREVEAENADQQMKDLFSNVESEK